MNDTKDIHEKVTDLQASQEDITLRQQQSIENQRLEIVSKAILKVVMKFSKAFISKDQVKDTLARLESKFDTVFEVVQHINATLERQPSQPSSNPQPDPTALEIHNSFIDSHERNRTIFYALKTTASVFDGVIKYDKVPVNEGSALIGHTGIFVAPRSGYFVFRISAMTPYSSQSPTTISVLKNGNLFFKITEGKRSGYRNIPYSWMEPMTVGDTLKLEVTQDKLYADSDNCVHFSGFSLVSCYSYLDDHKKVHWPYFQGGFQQRGFFGPKEKRREL